MPRAYTLNLNLSYVDMADNTPQPEQLLREYQVKFPDESATIQATRHFLKTIKENSTIRDQIMASAWIFNPHTGKVLLRKNKNGLYTVVQEAINHQQHDIQQATLNVVTKKSQLKHLQLYANELFHLHIALSTSASPAEQKFYYYDFCFLLYTHESTEQKVDNQSTEWVSPSQIKNDDAYRSVYAVAKKWQLFCYEKAPIA